MEETAKTWRPRRRPRSSWPCPRHIPAALQSNGLEIQARSQVLPYRQDQQYARSTSSSNTSEENDSTGSAPRLNRFAWVVNRQALPKWATLQPEIRNYGLLRRVESV